MENLGPLRENARTDVKKCNLQKNKQLSESVLVLMTFRLLSCSLSHTLKIDTLFCG